MFTGVRRPKNTAVFISGGGSTLQALLELQHQFSISLVVSNKKNILGLLKSKRFGRNHLLLNKDYSFQLLTENLKAMKIDQIFLAGYMKLLPASFVNQWPDKIFNIHPSLLPLYPGLNAADKNYQEKKQLNLKTLSEANILLRRTEQHLLREFIFRRAL